MKKYIFILLSLICLGLQAKRKRELPSIKPQNLSEIKLEVKAQDQSVPLLEKTTLTMDEAVQIALQNKPDLKSYQYAIEESRMRSKQAIAGYIPTFGITGNLSQTRGQTDPVLNVDFLANQLVYSFAGPIEQYRKARKATKVSELLCSQTKNIIRYEVEKAFLECWKVQQQNLPIRSLKKSSDSTYEKAAHSNKLELLDKRDWMQSTATHAQDLSRVDNYYEGAMISQKKLEFFMGQPVDLQIAGIKEIDSKYVDKKYHKIKLDLVWQDNTNDFLSKPIDIYYDLAFKNRDELKISVQNIGIAKDNMRLARGSRLPTVGVSFSAGTWKSFGDPTQEIIPTQTRRNYQTISANFSWNLFDGLVSYYQENEFHANMLKETLNREQIKQQIKFEVEQAYYTLIQSQNSLTSKKFDLDRAKNELTLQKQQLEIGNISQVEMNTAQTDWENAYYSWLDTKIDVEIKKTDLLFVCNYPEITC
jgi:outer membrane protein TolC